jgi:hypothetical protein
VSVCTAVNRQKVTFYSTVQEPVEHILLKKYFGDLPQCAAHSVQYIYSILCTLCTVLYSTKQSFTWDKYLGKRGCRSSCPSTLVGNRGASHPHTHTRSTTHDPTKRVATHSYNIYECLPVPVSFAVCRT